MYSFYIIIDLKKNKRKLAMIIFIGKKNYKYFIRTKG